MEIKIPLSSLSFVIDEEDFELVSGYSWGIRKDGYVYSTLTMLALHNIILHIPTNYHIVVDHIDRDKLNNRRNNLRVCSKSQNAANANKTNKPTSSRFKGVSWDKYTNKWHARIFVRGKRYDLGYFEVEEVAAQRYKDKAKELQGDFAYSNF